MATHGASGRGTSLLYDGASRRLRTTHPVCSQRATCMNAVSRQIDSFMDAGIPIVCS